MKTHSLPKRIPPFVEQTDAQVGQKPAICSDCNGVGYICKVFGETKTCLKCLRAGRLG